MDGFCETGEGHQEKETTSAGRKKRSARERSKVSPPRGKRVPRKMGRLLFTLPSLAAELPLLSAVRKIKKIHPYYAAPKDASPGHYLRSKA